MSFSPATAIAGAVRKGSGGRHLALLWLAGISLRIPLLAVPPVLTTIHRDLRLDETLVGALTALPTLLLSAGAVSGSLLVARLGARRALLAGLLTIAFAGAARGAFSSAAVLFLMTFVMGAGVAVSQPALPSLVRGWFPARTGLATAIYANGLVVGEIVAAGLTVPLVLPLAAGSWQGALAIWSVPILAIAGSLALGTAQEPPEPGAIPPRWWPDWRDGRTWRLGLVLGGASLAYFGTNAFLPDYLRHTGHGNLIAAALITVNFCQFPASLVAALLAGRLVARRWPLVLAGLLVLLAAPGLAVGQLAIGQLAIGQLAGGGIWVVVLAGVIGFSTALVLVLTLALPPLLAGERDVHMLTAAMFTITYACSFVGSLVGGAIWDLTGIPVASFVPVAAAGLLISGLAAGLRLPADLGNETVLGEPSHPERPSSSRILR